jgi:hypothetical protein
MLRVASQSEASSAVHEDSCELAHGLRTFEKTANHAGACEHKAHSPIHTSKKKYLSCEVKMRCRKERSRGWNLISAIVVQVWHEYDCESMKLQQKRSQTSWQ